MKKRRFRKNPITLPPSPKFAGDLLLKTVAKAGLAR